VDQVSFSGEYARENRKRVLFITERAVFILGPHGLTLQEIAPGIDLDRDVLSQMNFTPAIQSPMKLMDARIFRKSKMGLKIRAG
jgi:propionate CoA-transferase